MTTHVRCVAAIAACALACGVGSAPASPETSASVSPPHAAVQAPSDDTEAKLDAVASVHGAPGPWAVLGYRMSEHALGALGLRRGSFDLEVVHHTPKEVRYSCIADGVAAHSGASLGKLNLSLAEATAEDLVTVYRNKKTGRVIALRPTTSFRARFADTPRDKARELGRLVLTLPVDQVFEEASVQ